MYNADMSDEMPDTRFLIQPRGPGTAYVFRMRTPPSLVGKINPRTGKPYGREIKEGLNCDNPRDRMEAIRRRDVLLGQIRREELGGVELPDAMEVAASLRDMDDDARDIAVSVLADDARKAGKKIGHAKAGRWYRVAAGMETPFKDLVDKYKADPDTALSLATLNNLATAVREFLEFAGEGVSIEEVDRRKVAEFLTDYLPKRKGPKAPQGQGPATIRKKASLLSQVWRWAQRRGFLPYSKETPWDGQAPNKKAIKDAQKVRRPFTPEEVRKLLEGIPAGTPLGDAFRVAILTGVRLEEVASLTAKQVDADGEGYSVKKGKTENAARYVPLADLAAEVVKRRLAGANGGALFPELPVRKSTGKQGGKLSQDFTRVRRDILGEETDGDLAFHSFRHTWRTAARRAGVDLRSIAEMGGWSRGDSADAIYDHGLETKRYREMQATVAAWMRTQRYLD